MDRVDRDLSRAVRALPREERERYAEEWGGDVAAASDHGAEREQVARGARTMGRRRRMRALEGALAGRRGAGRAVAGWAVVAAVVVAAAALGGPFVVLAVLAAGVGMVAAFRAGVPSRGSAAVMVVCAVVGPLALVFALWAFAAMVAARDVGLVEPVARGWIAVALGVALVAAAGFVAALVVALVREARINRSRPERARG